MVLGRRIQRHQICKYRHQPFGCCQIQRRSRTKDRIGRRLFPTCLSLLQTDTPVGDVPYLDREITEPKLDFIRTTVGVFWNNAKKTWSLPTKWVPEVQPRGRANKDACGVLLMKLCMATGDFDRAITVGKEIVGRHPLMTNASQGIKQNPTPT